MARTVDGTPGHPHVQRLPAKVIGQGRCGLTRCNVAPHVTGAWAILDLCAERANMDVRRVLKQNRVAEIGVADAPNISASCLGVPSGPAPRKSLFPVFVGVALFPPACTS